MSTLFPGAIDNTSTLPYPTATSARNSPSLAGLSYNQNDAIIATQAKVGTGASNASSGAVLVGTGAGISNWQKLGSSNFTSVTGSGAAVFGTSPILATPTINSPIITNANITADAITGYTTANSGTIYGVPVSAGVLSTANTINGSALITGSVPNTAITSSSITSSQIATNGVSGANLATSAIKLGYAQITSTFTTASTTATQITGLTATVTVPSGGRSVKITAFSGGVSNNTAGASDCYITIWDGIVGSGTQLSRSHTVSPSANYEYVHTCIAFVTPAAGSKTYNVGAHVNTGTGSFTAGATFPAFILVELI